MAAAPSPDDSYDLFPVPRGAILAVARGGRLVRLDLRPSLAAAVAGAGAAGVLDPAAGPLPEVRRQLEEYFAGRRRTFDLPLGPEGTGFQQRVWKELLAIPFGETRSYFDVARSLGQPTATRAVGAANGRNPISIVIPCHRVIGSDGSLTGYGGGLPAKQYLLEIEGLRTPELFPRP
jgi:methylated-DNA-[protein]-cysteine S-methyltransferase